MTSATQQMEEIDRTFRAASGISDRRYYKIFYSHVHPFPILVIGQNPGGETDGTDLVASETYFENWEHDYLCFRNDTRYALARPVSALLAAALQTNAVDTLRQVPATNVIFRRSRNTQALNLSTDTAAKESAPALSRIIEIVNPRAVLLVAKTAYELFAKFHCERGSLRMDAESQVFTPNGNAKACIFFSTEARVLALDRAVPLYMVGHPSKYARRTEWSTVVERLREGLERRGVAPIEASALVQLTSIACYGASV